MLCPLCRQENSSVFFEIEEKVFKKLKRRTYFQCSTCDLVYLLADQRLSLSEEKQRYDAHQNDLSQEGYKDFLMQLWQPMQAWADEDKRGLDYGSGPNPALAELMKASGYSVDIYDPIYAKNNLRGPYQFITCTEVIEHVFDLKTMLENLNRLLQQSGFLGLMTDVFRTEIDFAKWRYRHDDTHICFLTENTLEFMGRAYGWKVIHNDQKRVCVFQKS